MFKLLLAILTADWVSSKLDLKCLDGVLKFSEQNLDGRPFSDIPPSKILKDFHYDNGNDNHVVIFIKFLECKCI